MAAVMVAVASIAVGILPGTGAVASSPGTVHLPDLQTKPPRDLRITNQNGVKLLRLSNEVWNAGDGPLDLRAENVGTTTTAYQRLMTHDDNMVWSVVSERLAGTFAFHSAHNHWHFGDFAKYELRANDRRKPGALLRSGGKTSFCIVDTTQVSNTIPHAMPRRYSLCTRTGGQGLAVGWSDTYLYNLAGQSIDITGLPNGAYWLISTADPSDHLLETNEANNAAQLFIRIRRDTVTLIV